MSQKYSPHSKRLHGLFMRVIEGQQEVNPQSFEKFIEAILDKQEPVSCVEKLISSKHGLEALRSALSINTSAAFINKSAAGLLQYFRAPALTHICGGEYIRQIVSAVVSPPTFWNAFVRHARSAALDDVAMNAFGWLLLQLLSLSSDKVDDFERIADDPAVLARLLDAPGLDTRTIGAKIKHLLALTSSSSAINPATVGGGRHDNDFANFREISILPSADEIVSKDPPFLRRAIDVDELGDDPSHLLVHIDNQFRLLREDMLRGLKEDLQIALGKRKGRRKVAMIDGLMLEGIDCGTVAYRKPWTLQLRCQEDFPLFKGCRDEGVRRKIIKDKRNAAFLKAQSLAGFFADGELITLVTIHRDEELLARRPPIICVRVSDPAQTQRVLLRLPLAHRLALVQLNTAVFAYEPVLVQLQNIKGLGLSDDIVYWKSAEPSGNSPAYGVRRIQDAIAMIQTASSAGSSFSLEGGSQVTLDEPQSRCLTAALSQRLSLVQGPPGTGKSFIGALAAKALHNYTTETILVLCYTHHALDQFLEDLLKIGIPSSDIIRLGATDRSNDKIKEVSLFSQKRGKPLSRDRHNVLDKLELEASETSQELKTSFGTFESSLRGKLIHKDLMEFLDVESDDPAFPAAFTIPAQDGMTTVGPSGKAISPEYLFDRWVSGRDGGVFKEHTHAFQEVWALDIASRQDLVAKWQTQMLKDQVESFVAIAKEYTSALESTERIRRERDSQVIQQKRVVGCTTTAAAKYSQAIQEACPGIVIVEEAGEILESHILAALSPDTQHLVLIGDHKQLRPKAEYDLSVEKGNGYDLNRSLFERLVLKGFPHHVLSQQHRMRPEISSLIRHLTYPDLIDAPSTLKHPDIRGFQNNVVFVAHQHPEDQNVSDEPEWQAMSSGSSKKNTFEARMTLKCVRYLGQQGYGTDDIVILTPYLGQLRLLMDVLGKENDPVLNDLDSYDLIKAGLMTPVAGLDKKRKLKISTIDNYQGQESDIVVVSFTRSNPTGDIGFMSSPERLNVALSRARNGLIMIGNSQTFIESRKGGELWTKFIKLLKEKGHIYQGFPLTCEQHPNRKNVVAFPEQFDTDRPDGGCTTPCGVMLNCGAHTCPSKCHQLSDHSKMRCQQPVKTRCPRGHQRTTKCSHQPVPPCPACEREDKKRDHELKEQEKRDRELAKHAAAVAAMDEEIRKVREKVNDQKRADEMKIVLEQKRKDLEAAKQRIQPPTSAPHPPLRRGSVSPGPSVASPRSPSDQNTPRSNSNLPQLKSNLPQPSGKAIAGLGTASRPPKKDQSAARKEWERQKRVENASNDAIDALMDMIGLEDVKAQVLKIKAKLDTAVRQGTDLSQERFGVVLLGNPGTGKTTVARHYAKFLASIGVLPGGEFFETTGSRLANEGVSAARTHVETIVKAGGGAFFLDEAYQLSEGNNPGGTAVLDFLLAEVENQTGKIVFILAGYDKQMESFFKHNPGFMSRFPYTLRFADYTDQELLEMFGSLIRKKYKNQMKLEDGIDGLYCRILTRRLGRGRGRDGFGNARALHNVFAKVSERQAERLQRERREGKTPDDFLLTREDLIGPEPTNAIADSTAWKQIQSLIGLNSVKKSIQALLNSITNNYMRELREKSPIQVSLNRVFLGPPGTGKTSVGKLYGQVLADLGLLSSGEVVIKNPSDFVGAVIGGSEANTKAILAASQGKVLIIDEAYMLGGSEGQSWTDPFRTAVVDTIVAEVQSTPGEDRCVLLLGYKEQMMNLFKNTNPGLARRFPLETAFVFEDFDDDDLRRIFDLKLQQQELDATPQAKDVAIAVLARERMRPNFGNGGAVENLIGRAKASQQIRESSKPLDERADDVVFEPQDFDADFDRAERASTNCRELFKDVVGQEGVIRQLEEYQQTAAGMRAHGLDPRSNIPFNFIFKGPPGTGKTTTARKVGQVFYDMGFLSSTAVTECSVSDLVGQYIGHTAPKVTKMLEKALGGILFIDEAYRLGEGPFATEAIDEIVDSLTKERFMNKVIVILAGYEHDMNHLLTRNPGLSSRFAAEVAFESLPPRNCLELLESRLKKLGISVADSDDDPLAKSHSEILKLFQALAQLPSWGNGRDIENLTKTISGSVFTKLALNQRGSAGGELSVGPRDIVRFLEAMLRQKEARGNISTSRSNQYTGPKYASRTGSQRQPPKTAETAPQPTSQQPNPPQIQQPQTSHKPAQEIAPPPASPPPASPLAVPSLPGSYPPSPPQLVAMPERDPGVSDAVWQQLQTDANAQEEAEQARQAQLVALEKAVHNATADDATASDREKETATAPSPPTTTKEEPKSLSARLRNWAHEQARLDRVRARDARKEREEALLRARREAEERAREEARCQQKLRVMGVCCMGYRWIRQAGGYRCAGGSHFVGTEQLERAGE